MIRHIYAAKGFTGDLLGAAAVGFLIGRLFHTAGAWDRLSPRPWTAYQPARNPHSGHPGTPVSMIVVDLW